MNDPSGSSPAFGSAHPEQGQFAQSHSGLVGSHVGIPTPDHPHEPQHLHGTRSLTSSPVGLEGPPIRRRSSADSDQAALRPDDETRVDGQREIIASSGTGHESQDTVTKPPNSVALAQESQVKTTASPAPSTSRQLPTSPFASLDGDGASNPDVDTARLSSNPADIRRHAPLPPLPQASSPGMSPSLNSSSTNPVNSPIHFRFCAN
jgi:hypothetical protein